MAFVASKDVLETGQRQSWSSALLRGWCEELAGCLPSQRALARRRHVRMQISSTGVDISVLRNARLPAVATDVSVGGEQPDWAALRDQLRRRGLSRLPVVVLLDPDRVLVKHLKLPIAVNSVLEPVLRNQLRRLSPWPEDQTAFGYRTSTVAGDDENLNVDVAIIDRPLLDDLLERLRTASIEPSAIGVARDKAAIDFIALYNTQAAAKVRSARRIKWLLMGLLAVSLAIGGFGFAQLLDAGKLRLGLEQSIQDANRRLTDYRRQLDQRGAVAQERARLIKRRGETPPAVWVRNTVTKVIPDHTWLRKLSIENGEVVLTGTSANTAALVPLLEQTGKFTRVRFNGPTTREPRGAKETFSISAKIRFETPGGGQQ